MRSTSTRRIRPAFAIAVAATAAVPFGLSAVPASAANGIDTAGPTALYIVQTAGNPLSTNPATRPARGQKVKTGTPAARAYRAQLAKRHAAVLKAVRGTSTVRDYGVAFNGFAARLTQSQAAALAKRGDVVRVWKNETRYATTNRTPDFLGMTGKDGVWQKKFGGPKNAGAGMIVGVIDSGIWPENPSFAPLDKPKDQKIIDAKWNGVCDGGTGPNKVTCNNKVIGARAYYAASTVNDFEFKTPRGYNSHGTHTAATAAGNHGVQAKNGDMDLGTVSGMAPAARIAAYKALWATPDGRASGATVDLVAAIDQAVADGVDVINYSISGSLDSVVSPDAVAFFNAAQAGVFVAAAAGNEGDSTGASSVNHNFPWVTTVAASTADRPTGKTVTTGDGASYQGVGMGAALASSPLVDAASIPAAGVSPDKAKLCYSDLDPKADGDQPSIDAAKAKGKIVLCLRGDNARVDKSKAVRDAGGVGMILANTTDAQDEAADLHFVPSIHVDAATGTKITDYIKTAGDSATAAISATDTTAKVRAPKMAAFSSYGPALAGGGDLLKPDITAPGVDTLAAVSPMGDEEGKNFDLMSGTSMATPHIAGIGALIKSQHPDWSPVAVKSAMMTTASQTDNTGQPIQRGDENATPLDMGAGHVTPKAAFDPGLVYDSTPADWVKYACGIGQAQAVSEDGFCDKAGSIDPSDLNYPSIAIGDLAGTQTITRTVKNVSGKNAVYRARVQQPTGVSVAVSPSVLDIPAGQSRTFTVTFKRTAAQFDQYAFGALTWQSADGKQVRSPLAIRPVAVATPAEVTGTGSTGTKGITIKAGVDGTLTGVVNGMVPGAVSTASTPIGKDAITTVDVPAGTKAVRFATYDADYPKGTDIDLTVTKDGKEVGTSGSGTAQESVTLTDPTPGTYEVKVNAFAGADPMEIKTHSFVVPAKDAGNLAITPTSGEAKSGQSYPINLTWSNLEAGKRWMGVLDIQNNGKTIGSTVVSVNP